MAREIVAIDVGGTHVRFALAEIAGGQVVRLSEPITLKTAEHASLQLAWEAFGRRVGHALPRAAAIAVAAPIEGAAIKLTNSAWIVRPAAIGATLSVDDHVLINDFGAVGHAVAHCGPEHFRHLCGPDVALPADGVISIVGPGTGLGVAQLVRRERHAHVVETEGGHVDFAPLDDIEDRILASLRARYGRVSIERIVAGPGLANIHEALAAIAGEPVRAGDDARLWARALEGGDGLAAAAFDRFCLSLGAIAVDLALAHGAAGVVIAGGLGARIADRLPGSGFARRFVAKGRFERRMAAMPVKLITHPQPGLLGAAAAFAQAHPGS